MLVKIDTRILNTMLAKQTQEHIKYIHHYEASVILGRRDGSLSVNKCVVLRRVNSLKIDLFQPHLLHMATS